MGDFAFQPDKGFYKIHLFWSQLGESAGSKMAVNGCVAIAAIYPSNNNFSTTDGAL
jgi:hypothetical protein